MEWKVRLYLWFLAACGLLIVAGVVWVFLKIVGPSPARATIATTSAVPTRPAASPADSGRHWNAATASSRREEVVRVLGNISSRGCRVLFPADYCVSQLNDLYAAPATQLLPIPQALALVATAAGEIWDC